MITAPLGMSDKNDCELFEIAKRYSEARQYVEDVGALLKRLGAIKDEIGRAHRGLDAALALDEAIRGQDPSMFVQERSEFLLALVEVPSHRGSAHLRKLGPRDPLNPAIPTASQA